METERLAAALSESGFWPQAGPVKTLETHISRLFLVGDRAYKLKKPVDFGFVDFSTLEKRRFFCEEEVRLNRRLAPDLYLGLRRITGSMENLQFDGRGDVVDYVIEMKRFDQAGLLGNVERAGKLKPQHMDQLARIVAEFHQKIPFATPTDVFGSPEGIASAADENFAQILSRNPPSDCEALLRKLRSWAKDEHSKLYPLFERRRARERIREGHGDLHLGNIILTEETITVFDCIEFNEHLRWVDVMSDVAFCAMDLASRRRDALSSQFLNVYLEHTGDYDGVEVLRYYLSYRAMVRAKISWLKAQDESGKPKETDQEECSKYLSLADRYARQQKPRLFVMHGLSGTGKSTGGEKLVRGLGAIRIRSDVERKRIAAATEAAALYTPELTKRTYARLHEAAASCLRGGFLVVLDATYLQEEERARALAVATELDVPCHILHVTAAEETLKKRIYQRQKKETDPSDADLEVLRQQIETYEPLTDAERERTVDVDTEQPNCWAVTVEHLNDG